MSDSSTIEPFSPALDNTMGVLLIGVTFAMALWGASSVQVYYYYNRYVKDPLWIKCLVAVVWTLDTVHQGMIIHLVYTYLVTYYGQEAELNIIVQTLMYEVTVSAIAVMCVQGFFILRIYKLGHENLILPAICSSVVLANVGTQIAFTAKGVQMTTYTEMQSLFQLSRTVNILCACSDVVIAASLIYLLQSSRTGFRRSDSILNRLIMFSMNTGLITSLDAVASLITVSIWPTNFIYIMFFITGCKLYSNSLMATLNGRKNSSGLGEEDNDHTSENHGFRTRALEVDAPSGMRGMGTNHHTLSIKVATETVQDRDDRDMKDTPSEETDMYSQHKAYGGA